MYPEDGGNSFRETAAPVTYYRPTCPTKRLKIYTILISLYYTYIEGDFIQQQQNDSYTVKNICEA
jgi:hypothetical protein